MDGWPAFPSGQCRGRSWPNAYGRHTRRSLSRRSLVVHLFIHSLIHSSTSQPVSHARDQHRAGNSDAHHVVLWNPFHRRFVLTEHILCCKAGFVIHSQPAFASSAWIYLVDVLQV